MKSETLELFSLLANKGPNYTSAYELFPQFLFRNARRRPTEGLQKPANIYTQQFDLEDFPDLQATTYEPHSMMHPRFYFNATVFLGEKLKTKSPIQPEQATTSSTSKNQAEASGNLHGEESQDKLLSEKVKVLEASLAEWKAKAEEYYNQRDPKVLEKERLEREERERQARLEQEERERKLKAEAEERAREAERIERERIAELKRQEEALRVKKEIERAQKIKERDEYYQKYDWSSHHFRYYDLAKMDDVNLSQLYVFAKSDPSLENWQVKIRNQIYSRNQWKIGVTFPHLKPQIKLLTNPKYIDLGSTHKMIGNIAKVKRFYTQYHSFPVPTHSALSTRIKSFEVYHNF